MPLDAGRSQAFADFVLGTQYRDMPVEATERAKDLLLDLIGVSAAAHDLPASTIGRETALRLFNTGPGEIRAPILFDGRTASLSGAAYAGANQIDSLDAHDGYSLAKGHAGCGLLPSLLAFAEKRPELSGRDFLAATVLGYEIACRAGVALHGTVSDYHTSGAWVAVAVAALGVRLADRDGETLRQAIGIAEYHGPRSQMMREIDNPTMLHDGSGWGAMVGVTAAELALAGFAGAPAVTVEREDAAGYWADLGDTWLTLNQNIKLFPVCRWAHAPIEAARQLRAAHDLQARDIARVEIFGFHEATRLAQGIPTTTGMAQYSISYPIAAMLARGELGAAEVSEAAFGDADIARLVAASDVAECAECNANFPQDRLGRTVVTTQNGRRLDSGIVRAPGEHTNPIDRAGIVEKFHAFTRPVLDAARAQRIEETVLALDREGCLLRDLSTALYPPVE